jgi:hypothetical protein
VQAEALSKVDLLAAEKEETETKLKVRSYVCRVIGKNWWILRSSQVATGERVQEHWMFEKGRRASIVGLRKVDVRL